MRHWWPVAALLSLSGACGYVLYLVLRTHKPKR